MEPQIPPQVREYPLIRVRRPSSSKNGAGKRPVTSVDDDNSLNRIRSWMNRGGNYGVVARSDNDLVIFDSDSTEFSDVLKTKLPPTFTVVSGGRGWGEHLYYRCPEADIQSKWSDPEGSVRVKNWHCVGPVSEHPETGELYEVKSDEPIAEITIDDLRAVISELDTLSNRQPTRSGGGGSSGDPPAAARVGSFSEYPSRSVSVDTAYNWVAGNDLDDRFNRIDKSDDGDESADDFVLCKCMAEAGIAPKIITETMNQHRNSDAKWHYRDRDYRSETVENAIDKAVEDSYVDFSDTADMGPDSSERRKTEDAGGSQHLTGGEQTMSQSDSEYSRLETVTAVESDDPEEGDNVVRAMIAQIVDTEDTYQFAQVLGGTIETDETFGPSPNWQTDQNGQDKTRTIGSADPDYLRLVGDALNELADKIEDSEVAVNADAEAAEVEADD